MNFVMFYFILFMRSLFSAVAWLSLPSVHFLQDDNACRIQCDMFRWNAIVNHKERIAFSIEARVPLFVLQITFAIVKHHSSWFGFSNSRNFDIHSYEAIWFCWFETLSSIWHSDCVICFFVAFPSKSHVV